MYAFQDRQEAARETEQDLAELTAAENDEHGYDADEDAAIREQDEEWS